MIFALACEAYCQRACAIAQCAERGIAQRHLLRDIERLTKRPLKVVGECPADSDTPEAKLHARRPNQSADKQPRSNCIPSNISNSVAALSFSASVRNSAPRRHVPAERL